ncbi:class I SAM-dependent methyltransferase [candidate division KSB1 bacterium]|nr:class I SAM-dependent methyltransferase [candidate division KSB1 bacterium]
MKKKYLSEIEFHDYKAKTIHAESMYNQGAIEEPYKKMMTIVGDLQGKKILDLGCGIGWASVDYAMKGASVIGLDISMELIKRAKLLVRNKNLKSKIYFVQGSGEYLPFKKKFDLVTGVAILHHLDFKRTVQTLKKTLRANGRCIFMEPLDHNPAIKLFRLLTPKRRTEDEKPLTMDLITSIKNDFPSVNIYGYHLLSLLSFAFLPIKAYHLFRKTNKFLTSIDNAIFKSFPKVQKYCWGVIIEIKM